MLGPVSGDLTKGGNVTVNEGYFFSSAPAFQLTLSGDRIGNTVKPLRVNQPNGPSRVRIATKRTFIVFCHPRLKVPACDADVETTVRTFENVHIRAYPIRPHTSTSSA